MNKLALTLVTLLALTSVASAAEERITANGVIVPVNEGTQPTQQQTSELLPTQTEQPQN